MPQRGVTPAQLRKLGRVAATLDPELDGFEHLLRRHKDFVPTVRRSIREAIDDVIDGRRTRRRGYFDLAPGERSFCGVRIESALMRNLGWRAGEGVDVAVGDYQADIKASAREAWNIGPSQVGSLLLLVSYDESQERLSVGTIRAHREYMNPSNTRDAKRTLSKAARGHIRWIARHEHLPVSILSSLSAGAYDDILQASARAERVARFLRHVDPFVPFSRRVLETVVGGDDPLRGTRADARLKGRGHPLGRVRVLSYQQNGILKALGQPALAPGEHVKVTVRDIARAERLLASGATRGNTRRK